MTSLPPQPPGTGPGPAPMSDADVRQWAGFAHLGGILGLLPSLVIWLIKKDQSAFVGDEAKKALNFQITLAIAGIALFVLDIAFLPGFIASLGNLALWIGSIVFSIQGFQAVNRGQGYTYPFSLGLVK